MEAIEIAEAYPARYWHMLDDGRIQCDLCPRDCKLHEGQRGACFVRARSDDEMVLTTYGRSSGFCVDPIEKKPLNHFYPGSSILSFGTAGCNLACKFCQNWDISKSRDFDRLADQASPEAIAKAAKAYGCKSVAFTYNDPVIFAEYAMDVSDACHAYGIKTVAVYERLLARGKSKMSALGAAMRKLVHLCFGVLKTRQPYRHDYAKIA
jgi:pyruvate formate lyase activating enzyme